MFSILGTRPGERKRATVRADQVSKDLQTSRPLRQSSQLHFPDLPTKPFSASISGSPGTSQQPDLPVSAYQQINCRWTALRRRSSYASAARLPRLPLVPSHRRQCGCGTKESRWENPPRSSRPSISPLALPAIGENFGLRTSDAWAPHPYASRPTNPPDEPKVEDG